MDTLIIPTRAWSAFGWVCLAATKKDVAPILDNVQVTYTPGLSETTLPTLQMIATDRYRIHRVTLSLDPKDNTDPNEWSFLVPSTIITEAAKHPFVGKMRAVASMPFNITVDDLGARIVAGYDGWGANYKPTPGNYPPVNRLIPEVIDEANTTGTINIRPSFFGDLDKFTVGHKRDPLAPWTLNWTDSHADTGKPGPIIATREQHGISALALIQPNLKVNQ